MVVLVTCKNEEVPIQNEGTTVVTTFFLVCSDAQGQLIPQSMVRSGRISNLFETLWLSLLPAKMKIRSKIKAPEC